MALVLLTVALPVAPAPLAVAELGVCSSFTSCRACNAHSGCAFCSDAADNVADSAANLGGWVFRQRGLSEQQGGAAARKTDGESGEASSHAKAHAHHQHQAEADATLLQHQPLTKSHRNRLLRDAEAFVELTTPQSGGGESCGKGGDASHPDVAAAARVRFVREAGVNAASVDAAWAAIFSSGGFCVNASNAATGSATAATCSDLRTSVCDCDGADIAALPQCHAIVDELRQPLWVAAAAFFAALTVIGAIIVTDLSWRRAPQAGRSCRGS